MNGDSQTRLLQLRFLVGFLGERAQFNWWPTSFAMPASRGFLEPVFPRTMGAAIFHGLSEAASRVHDEVIGVGRVFHLFRLSAEIEQDLHAQAGAVHAELDKRGAFKSRDAGLDVLAGFTDAITKTGEGPVAIGGIQTLGQPGVIASVASNYFAAFRTEIRSYPYFTTKH